MSPRPAKPQRSCTTDSACPQSTGAGVHHPQNTLGSLRRDCALRRPTTRRGAEPRLIRCCGQIHNATLADYGVPAEGDYRRPGTHPEDSLAVVRSARTHLTYGEWLRRGFDRRSPMLFLENFTALDKKCPDCHQVPSISGVCGCDSAFRSQLRSQHSTQQVQQPASQGRDGGAWLSG